MRIFIVIYLLITLGLLLFTAGIDNIFSEMQVVFDRYSHISIELLSAIIAFLVFFKANLFGSKTNDRRFIVIGTGFLVTGLFTIYHLLTSEIPPFDKITAYNLNEQIYFLFHRWFAIIAIFVAPFVKPVNSISMGEFKFKLYSAVLIVIVALAILLEVNNRFISPFIIQPESEIILKNSMLLIVLSLYILSTFIYIDKFLFTARRNIHLFLLGLIITGVNHLNLYTETVTPAEDIIYHLIRNIGFFFILLGLNKSIFENKTTYNYVFRSKNAIYYSVFYVGVSLIWIFTTSYLYIPEFTRITIYMLLLYLILVFLGGYRLSQKISLPISNLHTGVDNLFSRLIYKDTESKGNDLELIPVVSSDEIGEITAKINIVVDSYNNVGQEYEKNLAIERLHRDIIDLFSHFKFTEALQKSVNKIGEYFSVDRSSIVLSDGNRIEEGLTGRCSVIEYLRNSTIPVVSISKDIEPYFESFLGFIKDKKILVINDSQKAVFSADIEKFYNLSNTRSHISVVLEYERDFFGILKITQINSTREWTESEVNLINSLAKVLSNELYKQKLFQEIDTRIYRENQLSKIFDIIRKTQDVDKIPELLCREILELFNLDRVVIVQYKPELEERVIIATECRSSNDIPEMHGTSVTKDTKEYFYLQLKENNEIVINNRDEADLPSFVKEDMKRFEAKALMLLPLYKEQDYWGFIDLTQTRYSRIWKEEEIALAKTITSAVYAAVEKAQLYTGLQIKTKKEDITDVFTKELIRTRDLNKLLGVICKEALDIFQVDRITIRSYPVAEDYSQSELLSEYKSQPDIPEEKEMPYLSKITEYYATRLFDEERDIVYENIEESDLPDYFVERQKQIGVKSIIALPISNGENKLGIIILTSTHKYKRWSESEIELLHLIADYLFISIREIKLYSNLQEKVNREKLLRDIIISIRGTFDLEAVKQYIVNAIGQTLDADRCDLHEIGPDVDPNNVTEYLSSQDLKSFKDVSMQDSGIKYWRDINIKAKAEVALYDPEKYIRDHHLEGTPAAKHIEEFKIKTGFGVPILYDSEVLGILIIHFTRKKFYFSEDDLEFVRTLSSQVGIAIYQTRVYSDLKFTAERERILRSISFEMKSVLGIKEIKKTLVENVGKYFNASRSYIVEYDPKTEIPKLVDDFAEWVSPGARSITSVNLSMGLFDQPVFKDARSYFEVHDVDKFIQENDLADYRETFRQANTHSFATVPIIYTDERIGILILSFTYDKPPFSQKDIDFSKAVADQAGIAIYQARLYNDLRATAERERALRAISFEMKSVLDIKDIKKSLVENIGKYFNVSRSYILEYDPITGQPQPVEEYAEWVSPNARSIRSVAQKLFEPPVFKDARSYFEVHDLDKFIQENDLTEYRGLFEEVSTHVFATVPIIYIDERIGILILSFTYDKAPFSQEDINFAKTVADQAGIAIYQARLYNDLRATAERERVLRAISFEIRRTLDINDIKKIVVTRLGQYFNADRAFIVEYDPITGQPKPVDKYSEYLSTSNVKSISGLDFGSEMLESQTRIYKEKKDILIADIDVFLRENNLQDSEVAHEFFEKYNIEAGYGIPIQYLDQVLGVLVTNYLHPIKPFSQEEIDFHRAVADQTGIAIYQSRLYSSVQQTAERERILREIVSDIKLSESPDDIYQYLISKLSDVYDIDRVIFLKLPAYKYERLAIKYEYLRNPELPSLKVAELPEACVDTFVELGQQLKPIEINNAEEYHKDNPVLQKFFNDYMIKSALFFPLVKYNHVVNVWGSIALCSKETNRWHQDDIDLLNLIADPIENTIWQVTKRIEIDNLRNTFMLTLAHDLQVPIIGEHRALEFLVSRPDDELIGRFKNIIQDTIKSNENISALLTRLLDSYNYESHRQILHLAKHQLSRTINNVVNSLQSQAEDKSVKIDIQIPENLPEVITDAEEIYKVIYNLLDNAISYIQEGGHIVITSYRQEEVVATCISDNGPGIAPDIRERLFERYAMVRAIERKVGSGLGLYLSKQIVEAHNGRIWYTTELGIGTTFCFSLPMNK